MDDHVHPPLGLMAVGAGLKRRGHEVIIYDGPMEHIPTGYEGYGFGPTAPEYPWAVKALNWIEHRARIVLGGPHATLNADACQKDGWDCIVIGDGENVAELAFKNTNRNIINAPELPLSHYPFPDRTLVDIHSYHSLLRGRPCTTLVTSRGCPFSCDFCCKNNGRIRMQSVENVIQEINMLHYNFNYRALSFPEDIFILNRERTEKIAIRLWELGILWRCLVRADIVVKYGESFLHGMAMSGCVEMALGIESGSNAILSTIHKGETAETILAAIKIIKAAGIQVKGYVIVGLPGENEQTLLETERFLDKAKLDGLQVQVYQPYPGSRIYNHPKEYDIHWTNEHLEDTFFKGRPGDYRGHISTSALTTEQIVAAMQRLEERYR
jgi:radical SAM superfamily enzyme YgiQ (UPF0313 family)